MNLGAILEADGRGQTASQAGPACVVERPARLAGDDEGDGCGGDGGGGDGDGDGGDG